VKQRLAALVLSALFFVQTMPAREHDSDHRGFRHVLLLSIDGMHSVDFLNCSRGLASVNSGEPYCPNLAQLAENGVNFTDASTSKPSDSFPGLTALVSGSSPRTAGAFYDVAYDRSLDPPAKATGNGVSAGTCTPGSTPTGTRTEYEEGIDLDQTQLNGGAPGGGDGGKASIDPAKLPRDPKHGCTPVFPWNFVRTNTIFGVIHAAGGYTAWSDKHPAYLSVSGPGTGDNVDDYYSPEINSTVANLPGITTPGGLSCATIPDPSQTGAYTDSFQNIQCYDTLKVNAILNQIEGKTHSGNGHAPVPTIFGMNFQAVSVGQKLIEKNVGTGGYLDAIGTPSNGLLGEMKFVDASIGEMISRLKRAGLFDSTLIIVTSKHGQSPVDPARFFPIPGTNGTNGQPPSAIIASLLPDSEVNQIGPTEDDISLLWLTDQAQTQNAVAMLESQSPANNNVAGIGQIFWGASLEQMFNSAAIDPRTPDIVITPNVGVIYTGSSKKLSEHGGFAHDDVNVMMLVSNPSLRPATVTTPVQTTQVAPTILKALGLDPEKLDGVRLEHTQVLPTLFFDQGHDD
jgi:Type I phosphodiesterase / nucleotide pyrophosphatase